MRLKSVSYPGDIKAGMSWKCTSLYVGDVVTEGGLIVSRSTSDDVFLDDSSIITAEEENGVLYIKREGEPLEEYDYAARYAYKNHDGGHDLYFLYRGHGYPLLKGSFLQTQTIRMDEKLNLFAEVSIFSDTSPKRGIGLQPIVRPADIHEWGFVHSYNSCLLLKE